MRLLGVVVAGALLSSCSFERTRSCSSSDDCVRDGVGGSCQEAPGGRMYCAYPVEPSVCMSGGQWGPLAGDGLAGTCVDGACLDGASRPCGTDEGECSPGTEECVEGAWGVCSGAVEATAEVCNNLDDDCDGTADDGDPGGGADCDTSMPGVCAAGVEQCLDGSLMCVATTTGSDEVCNGEDDDCDGAEDEGCPDFFVDVTFAGTGAGRVRSVPAGIDCTTACSSSFATGTALTLHGVPAPGSRTDPWTGACSGSSCAFTVDMPSDVTATFTDVHEWSSTFGGAGTDEAFDVVVDSTGAIFVVGSFSGTVNFGGDDLTSGSTSPEAFVAKFSPTGTHLWSRRFGSVGGEHLRGVAVDPEGDIFIVGEFDTLVDFGGGEMTTAGGIDAFVAKLSGVDGAYRWQRQLGSTDTQVALGAAATSLGDVVIVGHFGGSVDFGAGAVSAAGNTDIFVAKYLAADGAYAWSQRFGDFGDDKAQGVAVDSSDNVLITGHFGGQVDFGGGIRMSSGSLDAFVAKYSTTGAHVWSNRYGGTMYDTASAIAVDATGAVYVAGDMASTINFGGGDLVPDLQDVFVLKLSAAGTYAWARRFGGSSLDTARGIAAIGSSVYVGGAFREEVDFGYGLTESVGGFDAFALELSNASGIPLWSNTFGGAEQDVAHAVDASASGALTVVGAFRDVADFGAGAATASSGDLFIGTYEP